MGNNNQYVSALAVQEADIDGRTSEKQSAPLESLTNNSVPEMSRLKSVSATLTASSDTKIEFVTVSQAAELEGITPRRITGRCAKRSHRQHYRGAEKTRINGIDVWRIPASSLSAGARTKYQKQQKAFLARAADVKTQVPHAVPLTDQSAEYRQLWDRFERKDSNFKRMADEALEILLAYLKIRETGASIGFAEKAIGKSHGAARSTIRRYLDYTKNHPRQHWLPLLCPRYHGGRARAEFTPAAYDFIRALKIKSPATNLRVLIRAALKEGEGKGWVLPSEDTIAKRLKEEPAWMFSSMAALERSFPTVERDYKSLALHQCWESDGRKADVFCTWPDGTVDRPFVIAIRDVRTRRVLAIRVCHAPDSEAVLGVYGAALTNTQAVPTYFKLDNGREYANKTFTGAQKTRYRFKPKVDEAIGILTAMAVKVLWAKPGQGRDKPIESWWKVIAENCDKLPEFAGAYCGKDPVSKPEGFDKKKAIPVEAYGANLIRAIELHETSTHDGHGMNGRTPLDLYNELAAITITRKPDASEIRRCKMGVISLTLDKKDASLRFKMKGFAMPMKYWSEELADLSASERVGRFNVHYDWGEPNSPVAVYRGDVFICDARPMGRIDFIEDRESGKSKVHARAKAKFTKLRKKAIGAAASRGSVALPDTSTVLALRPMAEPNPQLVIAPSTKVRAVTAPVSPIQADPDCSGGYINIETGKRYAGDAFQFGQEKEALAEEKAADEETAERLKELKRIQENALAQLDDY